MILTAKNKHAEWDIRVFNLDEVYWELDEAAKRDLKFLEAIKNSIDSKGMLWPPIVWTQKTFLKYFEDQPDRQDPMKRVNTNFIYRCAIGNSRFNYAKENGYTQIECVFVPKWQDKDIVLKTTQMEYCVDF
jgi:hypothetical protein|tara:strand:- start:197 stop:589 length:393 start_codon:yes stop_codon:yes gene_type:complete